ncbi:dienelactone hydrolase family protein [Porticoccaceae bacterium LTM1]|nr:dienelactone hydrolase family protein [Porticoccaceae bacterium LTM1]
MSELKYIEVETGANPVASVIWLHGLGANGHDFEPVVPELKLPAEMPVRFIFPHAPEIPVTINGGYIMPAWYDILEMDVERKVDEAQLFASAEAISQLIDRELERGIPSSKIVIAGFSQGGAVAYQCALTYPQPLAGLLALSTYFATNNTIQAASANESLPIQIMHGTMDPVVPVSLGRKAADLLAERGYSVEYRDYRIEHNVSLPEINDISQWLQAVLAK